MSQYTSIDLSNTLQNMIESHILTRNYSAKSRFVCSTCGKELTRYNAIRIGGMIAERTGGEYMCQSCVDDVNSGKIKIAVVRG